MSEITVDSAHAMNADAPMPFHVRDHHPENGTLLGFWLYLMSDCLIFACLFAAYGVLGRHYAAGPGGADSAGKKRERKAVKAAADADHGMNEPAALHAVAGSAIPLYV